MNLKTFLFFKEITLKQFCEMSIISYSHMLRVTTGRLRPTRKTLMLIFWASGKKVLPENAFAPTILPEWLKDEHAA